MAAPKPAAPKISAAFPFDEGWACARCNAAPAPVPTMPPLWIGNLPYAVATGDLIILSSVHSTSNITKFFTNSSWDHVGIVVRPTPARAYLVEWGMTPMEAIRAATSVAARYMGWEDSVGSLRAGLLADIVAVEGDPLADIRVLERVDTVVKGGLVFKVPADKLR